VNEHFLMISAPAILAAGDPLSHVLDRTLFSFNVGSMKLDFTMNTLTMLIAAVVFIWVINAAAKAIGTGDASQGNERFITKGKLSQMVEVIVLYLRDNVIKPQLGADTNRFLPLLLSIFFFILINNLFGLIPLLDIQHIAGTFAGDAHFAVIGGTATGRIAVTAALATVVFLVWNLWGIKSGGVGGWMKHFTGGAPWYLWPIMIPVELMGLIVKPAALTIRLFANMTAGHILLAVLVGFVAAAPAALGWLGAPVSVVAFAGAVAIMFLELFVAFLQAFIFMFLTTLFIAQMGHHHHDDHGHAEAYDGHHDAEHDLAAPVTA
jgi:F-type H+-transporting ATPase subunit a